MTCLLLHAGERTKLIYVPSEMFRQPGFTGVSAAPMIRLPEQWWQLCGRATRNTEMLPVQLMYL
jgi:hypothetical protein